MLMKAKQSIHSDEHYEDGDIFLVENEVEAKRLIELGAAVPVRKVVTLSFLPTKSDDGIAKDLMDKKRLDSNPDKITIDARSQNTTPTGETATSEVDSSQCPGAAIGNLGNLDSYHKERDEVLKQD